MHSLRAVWAILQPGERRALVAVFLLMLVGTLLETISLGLVAPVLSVLTGDAIAVPTPLRPWVGRLGAPSSPRTILLALAALVGANAVKSVYLLFAAYSAARFSRKVQANAGRRLFAVFLAQPWTFHLRCNSASLMHLITETQHLGGACLHLIQIFSETLVLLGLLGLLLALEPLGTTVVAGMLGLAFFLVNGVARPRTRGWAELRQHHMRMFFRHVQQALGGVKELKFRGCEREFLDRFGEHAAGAARMATRLAMIESMPRSCFELLAVAALFLLAAAMVWEGHPTQAIVPVLGLFAAAAFRVLPSINYATVAMQRLRQYEPMLETLRGHLAQAPAFPSFAPTRARPFRDRIRIDGVVYRYPDGHGPVLEDIHLEIPRGSTVGIVGASGAGKSTLVDVLLGLLPPEDGRVLVDGIDIHDDLRGWQQAVGYVPQSIYLCDESIRRNVAFGVPEDAIDEHAVRRALAAARLDDFVAGLPEGLDTLVGERGARLSGGQLQRIGIARALYHDPEVLVLDEATSALDPETERDVVTAIDSLHGVKTLVVVTHRLATVSGCDRVYRLENGRVVRSGSFAEIMTP